MAEDNTIKTSINNLIRNASLSGDITKEEMADLLDAVNSGKVNDDDLPSFGDAAEKNVGETSSDVAAGDKGVTTDERSKLDNVPDNTEDELATLTGSINAIIPGVPTYANGNTYTTGEKTYYEHVTGDIFPITKGYYLIAKGDFTSTAFDIFDWEIINPNSWVFSRVDIRKNNYEVFPGDSISIPSERYTLYNNRKGITKVEDLLNEYLLEDFESQAFSAKSILIPNGKHIFKLDWDFPEQDFITSIAHRREMSHYIYLDQIGEYFTAYIKINFGSNVEKKTTYPEVPRSFQIRIYPGSDNLSLFDTSVLSSTSSYLYYYLSTSTTVIPNTFTYLKLWRNLGDTIIKFKLYSSNEEPDI